MVWVFAVLAVLGVAALSNGGGAPAMDQAALATSQATETELSAPSAATAGSSEITAAAATTNSNPADRATQCEAGAAGAAGTSSLPAMRWSDFGLSIWDNSFLVKYNGVLSSGASMLFWLGDIMWKVLFYFLDFGVTFHPLCTTAGDINNVVADLGGFAAWFAIPILIFWLIQQRRSLARLRLGRVVASLAVTLAYTGGIFFVTQKAEEVRDAEDITVLTTTGTVPWMANSLMSAAASAYTSINELNSIFNGSGATDAVTTDFYDNPKDTGAVTTAFYDNPKDTGVENQMACYTYVQGLYDDYEGSLQATHKNSPQITTMTQMSSIWEQAFLSSWMSAQFGSGSGEGNYFPAQTACRHLEATVDVSNNAKATTFQNASGQDGNIGPDGNGLIHMMQPLGDVYRLPVDMNWASCQLIDDQWTLAKGADQAKKKDNLFCSGDNEGMPMGGAYGDEMTESYDELLKQLSEEDTILYLSAGEESIQNHIGNEPEDGENAAEFANYRKFAAASVGGNTPARIGHGLMAVAISGVYLWSFGPVALGLSIVGFAMIILLAIFPLSLLLAAIGARAGRKLISLTLATTAGLFIFGLLLSVLSFIITITNSVVSGIVGTTGGFGSQILLAATPVIAVLLLKKLLQTAGFGNLTSLSGALGMTSAIASKAAGGRGDMGASSAANRGINAAKRGLGAGANAARDPRALQRKAEGMISKLPGGGKALGAMKSAASKAREAGGAMGAIAKDRAQSAGEEFGQSQIGKALSNTKNKANNMLEQTAAGRGLKKAATGLAKSKTARYGGALAAAAGAAGALGPGAIPALIMATGAAPVGRSVAQAGKKALGSKGFTPSHLTRDDDGNLVLKDDDGNSLTGARQLAYARANGLMQKADVANSRIASRALKGMTPEEREVYSSDFDARQTAGMPLSQAHKEAQKTAIEARKFVSNLSSPAERSAALEAYASVNLDSVRARQNGALSAGGLHPGCAGFDNEIARQIGLESMATKMGVEPSDIVMGNHGIAVPAPTLADVRLPNNAPKLGENASMELAAHPALYLDRETLKREVSESDEQYSARITASMTARGLVDDSGNAIDVFSAHGIDVNTSSGAQRVQKWLDGGRDDVLGSIEYTKVKGEDQFLKAAEKWTNNNTVDHAERQWNYMVSALETRDMALTDTADIANIPVAVDASKLSLEHSIPNVFGTANPVDMVSGDEVAVSPRVQFKATPMAAGGGTVDAEVPVQQMNMAPSLQGAAQTVTLGETLSSMGGRASKMGDALAKIHDPNASGSIEDHMRDASRALEQVDNLERDINQALEGMRSSSYARAALAVDHYAATNPAQATHGELRSRSQAALKRAQTEAQERENILSRKLSGLFKATSVAQNSSDLDSRRKAFREAAQTMSDIEETMRELYEEESKAAKEMSESAEAALRGLSDALESEQAAYKGPNRSVISSTSIVGDMARRRKENFTH